MADTEPTIDRDLRGRDERAWQLIERCGYACAALTVLPIPYSETIGVTAVHVSMVIGLGKLHGVELGREHALKLVARLGGTVGLSYLGTRLALGTAKLILPVLPGLVGAPLVFASTLGIGAVAKATFEAPERELDDDEVRALYRAALDKAKGTFDPARVRSRDARADAEAALSTAEPAPPAPPAAPTPTTERARERLERLRRLRDEGFLAPDEYDAATKRVLEE